MTRERTALLKKFTHRHRRVLGSVSAALAVLFLFASLRSTPQATATSGLLPQLEEGQVAAPVTLRSSAITSAVKIGDIIDLVTVNDAGSAQLIASRATVIDIPGGGGFSPTSSAVIVVAIDHTEGTTLAANLSPDISFVVVER